MGQTDDVIAELNDEVKFYKASMERIANLFGIESPMQLIARAKNNEQTYVDILVEVIEEKLKAVCTK
jgi:hypothetical protein